MDRVKLESVEPSELTQVEGGIVPFLVGFALGFMSTRIGMYAADYKYGQTAMEPSESAAILGALKQGGII